MKISFQNKVKIVSVIGFWSCVIGWLGLIFLAPITLLCGFLLIRYKQKMSGIACLIIGAIQLVALIFAMIGVPISL